MEAKLRHPGCVCVTPTPSTQPCADGGKSARRDVEPRNTILNDGALAVGSIDDFVQPHWHGAASATHAISALQAWVSARRGLRALASFAGVKALTVNRRHLGAHRAQVHRQLSAVMNGVVQPELDVDHRGKLEDPAEVHRLDQLLA